MTRLRITNPMQDAKIESVFFCALFRSIKSERVKHLYAIKSEVLRSDDLKCSGLVIGLVKFNFLLLVLKLAKTKNFCR